MNKILMFDTEAGSHTLGGEPDIQKMFNCPVLRPATFDAFGKTVQELFELKEVVVKKNITDTLTIDEVQHRTVSKNGTNIDTVIIDSFSELAKKYQRSLTDKNGMMQMQSWGKLKNTLDKTLEFLTKMPGMLVVTCHSKVEQLEDGRTRIKPYIDGSTKDDMSKWFDFVFYTYTKKNGAKQDYMWRTGHTEVYEHAKDRTELLPSDMRQDFQPVIQAARDKGFNNVRILIIGSPGTGKTKSLSTLINKGVENGN